MSRLGSAAVAAMLLQSLQACWVSAIAQEPSLASNDISFLWPVPTTVDEAGRLLAADLKTANGSQEMWPAATFQQVMAAVPAVAINATSGTPLQIKVPPGSGIENRTTWKIAGIRIDPSAPGTDDRWIGLFGSTPQIRVVLQPITVKPTGIEIHDFAAHLAFDFVKPNATTSPPGTPAPAVPDNAVFQEVVNDLLAIRKSLAEAGVATSGPLGVHPGFANASVNLNERLRAFLGKHLREDRLNHIAFMGVKRPEPWIFVLLRRGAGGFEPMPQRTAQNSKAIMLFFRDPKRVVPTPNTSTFGAAGVSTAPLLLATPRLDDTAVAAPIGGDGAAPLARDIPDIIANPQLSHLLNTDCVSCHTESSLRSSLRLAPSNVRFAGTRPAEFSGLQPTVVSQDTWNVRNFGWGRSRTGKVTATVAVRTAHEAADSAAFINRHYLNPNPVSPAPTSAAPAEDSVSHALNLVMTAKSDDDFAKLKTIIGQMQALPPDQNPIIQAMQRLGNVHDARFVFLEHSQLAVITTYDDDFDSYIDQFVDEIGDVFNLLLAHVKDAPAGRVQDNREAFRSFVRSHDLPSAGATFSAYPKLRVEDIKALQRQAAPTP